MERCSVVQFQASQEVAAAKETVSGSVALSRMPTDVMNSDETVIEIADHRRRLQSATEAVVDAEDLCARARRLVQESQELLRQLDDLHGMGPVLRKNKHR